MSPMTQGRDDLARIRRHFDAVLGRGLAAGYGPRDTAMWMSSLDTRTGRYPADDARPAHIPSRCYRYIESPRGCNLYWDQPLLAAAHALSDRAGDARYADAADAYTRDYLSRCTAGNGIILWGNHYYWDAFDGVVRFFPGSAPPRVHDPATSPGDYHEMRPIQPAWGTMWRADEAATARAIAVAAEAHLVEPETGLFDRHADRRRGCAFLEAGGILVESLAWLFARTRDARLIELAGLMARYSFVHRGAATGLLINNPTETRWDGHTCTSEVGLWAGCLLRAAELANHPAWADMAKRSMDAWLRYAWDERSRRYFGRLNVADGAPIFEPPQTAYEPGDYCDLWRPLFPAHDYPMPLAEACLKLYRLTGDAAYAEACRRWAGVIERSLPARGGAGGYAEHYGRCIHFALGCAEALSDHAFLDLARRLADEAHHFLWAGEMFRSHPGEDRYDAVDGLGFLMLALIWLQTGREPDARGLGW